jgi:glutathione S-transferase
MIQLYQAEWCPYSSLVRQRLTELGIDFVARQVEPDPQDRDALREATGDDYIPAIVFDDGTVFGGDTETILRALDERCAPGEHERDHRAQAVAHGTATPA